ncbi:hypothetical protein [Rhizobium sp. CECT 9324]|uniref:hypothetical protein n=1 Tax=Rhizobium sp. CECT 9324 TaxID=2845820 RepID=UPI001E2ED95B|nr:hypothetical protein [Rhizobium sp. CECT 9324]CAH0343025.1 hypothetical protein RHI9324_04758 [Rhizobium sp. CECT 9324]
MSLSQPKRRRNLQSVRLAKANWLYTPEKVRDLYGIVPNTLSRWIKAGLQPIEHQGNRLFKGEVLNAFHKGRRDAAKRRLGEYEAYCVACKCKHSLLDDPISLAPIGKAMMVAVECSQQHTRAPRMMSMSRFAALCELRGHDPRAETPD